MTVVLHDVVIVPQAVDVQQAVHRDVQDLHEAAKIHHGGDQPLERMPDALL